MIHPFRSTIGLLLLFLSMGNTAMWSQEKRERARRGARTGARKLLTEKLESRQLLAAHPTPDFIFPKASDGFEETGIIDLTQWNSDPALNVDPTPGNNDHAALQAAIDTYTGSSRIMYLPAGEYEIDQPLVFPIVQSNRATSGAVLQGQNKDSVTIKVTDNVGLDSSALQFQIVTADAFRNAVRDLTIDIGSGNPLASGLTFTGNNNATIQNVHVVSSDPDHAGKVGLQLGTGENGPLLVENVSVDGFDVGIRTAFQTASQTFEDISLTNQQLYGWVNEGDQNVFARNVTSVNEVQAIRNFPVFAGENSVFTLVDSALTGVGNASDVPAIRTEERFYASNIDTTGYKNPISYSQRNGFVAGNIFIDGDGIEEYWSEGTEGSRRGGGTFELFEGSPDASLQLLVQDAPEVPPETDFTKWASPTAFVTTNPDGTPSGVAGDLFDDSLAIQAAIDSGATTLYFPFGSWLVERTVDVRGNVNRINGLESRIGSLSGDGALRIVDGVSQTVVYERFGGFTTNRVQIRHDSSRTLVARNLQGFGYQPITEAPGDLFIYDVVDGEFEFRNQNVWARQFNVEGRADVNDPNLPNQKILNDNSNLWVLGLKIENQGTIVRTINGGQTELLGVYRNNNVFSDADNPAFVTVDAATSVVNFDSATAASNAYALWASETRDGETRTSDRFGFGHVYSAFSDEALWDSRREIVIDNLDSEVALDGTWQTTSSVPGGFIDSDAAFSNDPDATATITPNLPVDGEYEVYLRWINNWGGQSHTGRSSTIPVSVQDNDAGAELTIDQTRDGGKWNSIGTFSFDSGTTGNVLIGTDDSNRNAVFDGARFVLRQPSGTLPEPDAFPIAAAADVFQDQIFSGGSYVFDGALSVLANDIELDGSALTVTEFDQGIGGRVEISPDGNLSYQAHSWFSGWDAFDYSVSNGEMTTTATVQVFVADSFDPLTGQLRRELTPAEQKEKDFPFIETIAVEEFAGDRASRLLGPGRRTELGIGGKPGHAREGSGIHFTGPQDASVTFDLGGTYELETTRIWNYNQQDESRFLLRRTGFGAGSIDVYADPDSDGNGFASDFVFVKTIDLAEASARNDYSGEVFDLDGTTARFVRLVVTQPLEDLPTTGLSEVEFRGSFLSEPSSPLIDNVRIADVSSEPNPDRRANSTLGPGYSSLDNVHGTVRGQNWESAADDPTPSVTYDLNDVFDLGSVRIWNYNHGAALQRGAKTIDVLTSRDNQTYTLADTLSLDQAPGDSSYNGQKFDFTGNAARYVRFQITESHGATGNVGLAEIQFFGGVSDAGEEVPVIDASTSVGNGAAGLINVYNGSGLDGESVFHDNFGSNRYTSNFNTTPTLDFELAELVRLGKINVWNFTAGQQTDRGIREARILTSVDGLDFQDQGVFEFRRGSSTQTHFDAIDLRERAIDARFVRLEVISNWGDSSFTGLGELKFFGTSFSQAPTGVTLSAESDLGFFNDDAVTRLSNNGPDDTLTFVVEGTTAGDLVEVFADGQLIGTTISQGESASVTTDGTLPLTDGLVSISAQRTAEGQLTSELTLGTSITIETIPPAASVRSPESGLAVEALDIVLSETVANFDVTDLLLSRDGIAVDLVDADLQSLYGTVYRLSGIGAKTSLAGDYTVDLVSESDVTDLAGNRPIFADQAITLISQQRAFNSPRRTFSVIEHRDDFMLDNGSISMQLTPTVVSRGTLFSKDHVNFGTGGHLDISLHRGAVQVRLQSTTDSFYLAGGDLQPGQTYDLLVRFGENGMQLILDGEVIASNAYTGGLGATSGGTGNVEDIVIGASKRYSRPDSNDRLRSHFNGRIADVRIMDGDGAILHSEAVAPYNLESTPNFFDGVDQFVEVEHSESLELESGMIELEFNSSDITQRQTLFSKDNRGFDDGGHLTASIINQRVEIRLQSDSQSYYLRSGYLRSNETYRLRFTFGVGGMSLFLDETLIETNDYEGGLLGNNNHLIIGASQWRSRQPGDFLEYYFQGTLGNFVITNSNESPISLV